MSHRFSTVRMADVSLVVDDRRVTVAGDHQTMNCDGRHAELYAMRAAAYLDARR